MQYAAENQPKTISAGSTKKRARYENVVRSYDQWRRALDISWKEYLSQIANDPLTGEWTRQVVQHVMKSEGHVNVKDD